jgi:hypothetical protein
LAVSCAGNKVNNGDPDKKHRKFVKKRQKKHLKQELHHIVPHEHEESPGKKKFRLYDFY